MKFWRRFGCSGRMNVFYLRGLHYVVAEHLRPVAHRFSSVRTGLRVRQRHLPKDQPVHEPLEAIFENTLRRSLHIAVDAVVVIVVALGSPPLSSLPLSCVGRRLHGDGSHRDAGALAGQGQLQQMKEDLYLHPFRK